MIWTGPEGGGGGGGGGGDVVEGLGDGDGEGDGLGEGDGDGLGEGEGLGLGEGEGLGLGDGFSCGDGELSGEGGGFWFGGGAEDEGLGDEVAAPNGAGDAVGDPLGEGPGDGDPLGEGLSVGVGDVTGQTVSVPPTVQVFDCSQGSERSACVSGWGCPGSPCGVTTSFSPAFTTTVPLGVETATAPCSTMMSVELSARTCSV